MIQLAILSFLGIPFRIVKTQDIPKTNTAVLVCTYDESTSLHNIHEKQLRDIRTDEIIVYKQKYNNQTLLGLLLVVDTNGDSTYFRSPKKREILRTAFLATSFATRENKYDDVPKHSQTALDQLGTIDSATTIKSTDIFKRYSQVIKRKQEVTNQIDTLTTAAENFAKQVEYYNALVRQAQESLQHALEEKEVSQQTLEKLQEALAPFENQVLQLDSSSSNAQSLAQTLDALGVRILDIAFNVPLTREDLLTNTNLKIIRLEFATTRAFRIAGNRGLGPYIVRYNDGALSLRLASTNSYYMRFPNTNYIKIHPHAGSSVLNGSITSALTTHICLGRLAPILHHSSRTADIKTMIYGILSFLQSVNTRDPIGRDYIHFPFYKDASYALVFDPEDQSPEDPMLDIFQQPTTVNI